MASICSFCATHRVETIPLFLSRFDADSPTRNSSQSTSFLERLRDRGVAIIRNVISEEETKTWRRELDDYVTSNTQTHSFSCSSSSSSNQVHKQGAARSCDLFWSPAQLRSRAHPNVLAAQKFVMGAWRSQDTCCDDGSPSSSAPKTSAGRRWRRRRQQAKVSTNFPVTYADRLRVIRREPGLPDESARPAAAPECFLPSTKGYHPHHHQDVPGSFAGSLPRQDGPYRPIWSGHWEDYDPWDVTERLGDNRLKSMGDEHDNGSVFRMFQGTLLLSGADAHTAAKDPSSTIITTDTTRSMLICPPLPLKLTTAYRLLRPLFLSPSPSPSLSPTETSVSATPTTTTTTTTSSGSCPRPGNDLAAAADEDDKEGDDWSSSFGDNDKTTGLLSKHDCWTPPLQSTSAGNFPSHRFPPPHLHQQGRDLSGLNYFNNGDMTMVPAPTTPPPQPPQPLFLNPGDYILWHPDMTCCRCFAAVAVSHESDEDDDDEQDHQQYYPSSCYDPQSLEPAFLSLPVCPLTRDNALLLARQRRAFVLGFPGPEFAASRQAGGESGGGESCYLGRPGVQEVHDVGGDEGLKAMGLLAWDDDEGTSVDERHLLRTANSILFPDVVERMTR